MRGLMLFGLLAAAGCNELLEGCTEVKVSVFHDGRSIGTGTFTPTASLALE